MVLQVLRVCDAYKKALAGYLANSLFLKVRVPDPVLDVDIVGVHHLLLRSSANGNSAAPVPNGNK